MNSTKKILTLSLVCMILLSVAPVFATTSTVNNIGNQTNQNKTVANSTVTHQVTGNTVHQNYTVTNTAVRNTTNQNQVSSNHAVSNQATGTMHVYITPYSPQAHSNPINNNGISLPTVNFTANVTQGKAPLSVLFTSNGTGTPTAFNWTFGDGIYSTHNWTAIHTYTQAGKYNVSVMVSNAAGNNTTTKTGYINVSKAVVVNNRILCTGKAPWKVSFKDKSKKHIASYWDLGDGTTTRSKNILHVYKTPGKYPITLKYVTVGHVKHTLHAGYILVK